MSTSRRSLAWTHLCNALDDQQGNLAPSDRAIPEGAAGPGEVIGTKLRQAETRLSKGKLPCLPPPATEGTD